MIQRQNGRQLIMIGIIIVIAVILVAFFLSSRGGGSPSPGTAQQSQPTRTVVVALQAIPQGTTFRYGQPLDTFFGLKDYPISLVPFGAYTSLQQIENVVKGAGCQPVSAPGCTGQITTTQTIYQNVPVVSGMFSTLGSFRQAIAPSFSIPLGYVGIAISLTDVNSVLGSINPGDSVDLMASYVPGGNSALAGIHSPPIPPQTQYVLNDLKVIGVGGPPPASSGTGTAPSTNAGTAQTGGTLVVLARYQEALEIQYLKDFGWQMSVVLRSAKEPAIPHFRTLPVTAKWYFAKLSNPFKQNPGY